MALCHEITTVSASLFIFKPEGSLATTRTIGEDSKAGSLQDALFLLLVFFGGFNVVHLHMKVSSASGRNPVRPPHPANRRRQSEHILLLLRHLLIPRRPLPTTAGLSLVSFPFTFDVTVLRVSFRLFSTCCSFHSVWLAGVMPPQNPIPQTRFCF